ncbi:MAG: septal ring lytic transglycosylase RlpA family protein [Acetobacteraceae bacterium]
MLHVQYGCFLQPDQAGRFGQFRALRLASDESTQLGAVDFLPDLAGLPPRGAAILVVAVSRLAGRIARFAVPGLLAGAMLAGAHAHARSAPEPATAKPAFTVEKGTASYYGRRHQGRRTASGARFEETALTGAHPWLPFGSKVRVTVLATGRSVVVTITDRLPLRRRVIDLSLGAARILGIVRQGVALVSLSPT